MGTKIRQLVILFNTKLLEMDLKVLILFLKIIQDNNRTIDFHKWLVLEVQHNLYFKFNKMQQLDHNFRFSLLLKDLGKWFQDSLFQIF